ncbi:MAG: phytoene desaturase [Gammaproteobacteria bacterium]
MSEPAGIYAASHDDVTEFKTQYHRPHAVIIGSGFGGLAAAVRLGARGYRTTVLERLDAPGGRAYTYHKDGYTFDAGPTIITAPYLFDELWDLCGKRLSDHIEIKPCDPFYKIRFDDGSVFNYTGDKDRMEAEIARFNPDDVEGYRRFMKLSGRIFKTAFTDLADKPFHSFGFTLQTMIDLVRLGGQRSVFHRVKGFFKDERLKIAFSFHPLLIGGNPFNTTSYYCLIAHLESKYGVHYAVGGTGALVRGLADLIEGQGGALRYNADVKQITVDNDRASGVTLASGERIDADVVISNADPSWTYGKLLSEYPRRRWSDAKIKRANYSMSLFVWYFGTNKRFDDVYHHTMVLGPRYRDLLRDIFKRKVLADDCSLYLHRPTAADTSLAPDGCDAFYVLSPVPHLGSGTDWAVESERYRQLVQDRLETTVLPGLGESIVTSHVLTPQDFQDRLCSHTGAAFSLEPELLQSAWFRPHNRSEELDGLYMVGAGTHPGAGMPGVLSSAKVLERLLPSGAEFAANKRTAGV